MRRSRWGDASSDEGPGLWVGWAVALVVAVGCSSAGPGSSGTNAPGPGLPDGTLLIQGPGGAVRLRVEIAETDRARAIGLMHRTSLAADAGMVFLFDRPTDGAFWMKNTHIPLSIAFWDQGGRIVAILDMDPCRADPCPLYRPAARYAGAVEANQGFFEEHAVRMGDTVILERWSPG